MPSLPEDQIIRLPERFVLTIRGNLHEWITNSYPHPEMVHALTEMFGGRAAAKSTFARFCMTVDVEEDTDQGDG